MRTVLCCLLLASPAYADIPLQDTNCGTLAQCPAPAAGVEYLNYSVLHGRLTVSIGGVLYDSGVGQATTAGATVYSPDGTWREVSTVWATYRTCNHVGRGQSCLTHYELKSGSIQ